MGDKSRESNLSSALKVNTNQVLEATSCPINRTREVSANPTPNEELLENLHRINSDPYSPEFLLLISKLFSEELAPNIIRVYSVAELNDSKVLSSLQNASSRTHSAIQGELDVAVIGGVIENDVVENQGQAADGFTRKKATLVDVSSGEIAPKLKLQAIYDSYLSEPAGLEIGQNYIIRGKLRVNRSGKSFRKEFNFKPKDARIVYGDFNRFKYLPMLTAENYRELEKAIPAHLQGRIYRYSSGSELYPEYKDLEKGLRSLNPSEQISDSLGQALISLKLPFSLPINISQESLGAARNRIALEKAIVEELKIMIPEKKYFPNHSIYWDLNHEKRREIAIQKIKRFFELNPNGSIVGISSSDSAEREQLEELIKKEKELKDKLSSQPPEIVIGDPNNISRLTRSAGQSKVSDKEKESGQAEGGFHVKKTLDLYFFDNETSDERALMEPINDSNRPHLSLISSRPKSKAAMIRHAAHKIAERIILEDPDLSNHRFYDKYLLLES